MKNKPVLYIIIPCYNEEKVLPITAPLFKQEIMKLINRNIISVKSKIMFVNDGSKDQTWNILCELAKKDDCFLGISQSRNRGHQNAVLAGLMESKDQCDITISIDCDGQDDINAMDSMVEEYLKGNEIVYGVRSRRDTDTFFKRFTAESFYKLLNWMGVEVIYNHADYRLVGFKSTIVYYERHERIAGESHYPLSKMLSLAFDGITSLSIKPIRMITGVGFVIAVLSFIGVLWSFVEYFIGETVNGWASMTSLICFIGGVQLLCLGILDEYIGKIYLEVKARPRYIISDRTYTKTTICEEENK